MYIKTLQNNISDFSELISGYDVQIRQFLVSDSLTISLDSQTFKEKRTLLRVNFYADLESKIKIIYEQLNWAALSGEYAISADYEKLIDQRIKEIGDSITNLSDSDAQEESRDLVKIINCVKCNLESFKLQVHFFMKSISNCKMRFIDYENKYTQDVKVNNINSLSILSEVFRINLNLIFLDGEFSFLDRIFWLLNKKIHDLNEFQKKIDLPYIQPLIQKCNILLAKFKYKDNAEYLLQSYNYYEGKDIKVELESSGQIYHRLKRIYSKDEKSYKNTIQEFYDHLPSVPKDNFYFFIKCHYFKNISENFVLLSKLITEYKKFRKGYTNAFDKYNSDYCLNFLENCKLTFILKQKRTSVIDVLNEITEIKSVQDTTNVKNYFPFLKTAEWFVSYINKKLESSDDSDVQELTNYLDYLESNITTASDFLRNSEYDAGSFIPFKPSYAECLERCTLSTGTESKMFIRTSYIVPVDYEKENSRIELAKAELLRLKAIVSVKQKVSLMVGDLHKQNENNNSRIEKAEFHLRNIKDDINNKVSDTLRTQQNSIIQILAIFAGIVIFASGSIQIFKSTYYVKDAAFFMLLFASSLSLVSLAVWAIFSNSKIDSKKIIFSIIVSIIFLLNGYAIFGPWANKEINSQELKQESRE